jgi:hypothetical protein
MAAIPVLAVAAGATALGSAVGTVMQGYGEASQLRGQANQSDYNALLLQRNADIVNQQTNASESLQRRRAGSVLASQRAAIAQGGLGVGGSMSALAAQSGRDAEMDALNIRYEGGLRETSLREEATQQNWQAKQLRKGAKTAIATSYLKGAASAYGTFMSAGGAGALGPGAAGPGGIMNKSAISKIGGTSGGNLF